MDKRFYDITVKLRKIDKKYINSEDKELFFRMLDEKRLMSILEILYELHRQDLLDIKNIELN